MEDVWAALRMFLSTKLPDVFASTIVSVFWDIWKTVFSWCHLLWKRHCEHCTVDKPSSDQFLDQRKEKLFLMKVTLLTPFFSDPDPHLIIRKPLLGLLLVYL